MGGISECPLIILHSLFVRAQLSSPRPSPVILSILARVGSLIVALVSPDKHSVDLVLSGVLNEDFLVLLIALHQVVTEKHSFIPFNG